MILGCFTSNGMGCNMFCCVIRKKGISIVNSYCEWLDEEEVNGWPKKVVPEIRDKTHEKKKHITGNFLRMELEKQKVGKPGCSNGDEENNRLGQFIF